MHWPRPVSSGTASGPLQLGDAPVSKHDSFDPASWQGWAVGSLASDVAVDVAYRWAGGLASGFERCREIDIGLTELQQKEVTASFGLAFDDFRDGLNKSILHHVELCIERAVSHA
jgi:hypothetical protein